jgi:hypothetical protein
MIRISSTLAFAAVVTLALLGGCRTPRPTESIDTGPQLTAIEPAPQLLLSDREWNYHGARGREIRTPHYHIFTTHSDPEVIDRLPYFLEHAFLHYQTLISASKPPRGPMPVYLFGERAQWNRFTAEFTDPRSADIYLKIQEGGYVDRGTAVFYDIRRMKTFAVTGHEGFHQYVSHYCKHRIPAWLDEGLACFFEGFFWEGERVQFAPQRNLLRLRSLRYALSRKTTLELTELLSTHPGRVIGDRTGKVASYYSQLWALVLYLRQSRYREGFIELLADAGTDAMLRRAARAGWNGQPSDFGPALFRAYISRDLPAVGREYHDYCLKLAGY